MLVLCHYVHCSLLQSVHFLLVPQTIPSVGSVSLRPLQFPAVCPLSVSTSHCTVCWFCVPRSTAVSCSLSTLCQYLTLYRLLVLCPYVHCSFLQSVHSPSVPHTVPYVGSVSLRPLQSSTVCPLSVITSHCTVSWVCVTTSIAVFYTLSTLCQYLTLYRQQFCAIMSTADFYSLSTLCQYLTLYRLLALCHYVHCSLLQSVHSLTVLCVVSVSLRPLQSSSVSLIVPHTVPSVGFVSLRPLLSSTFCSVSVSTSHCTASWFCVPTSTAVFCSLSTLL